MSAGDFGILPHRTASRNIRCTVIATFSTLLADNPDAGPPGLAGLRPDTASSAHNRFNAGPSNFDNCMNPIWRTTCARRSR